MKNVPFYVIVAIVSMLLLSVQAQQAEEPSSYVTLRVIEQIGPGFLDERIEIAYPDGEVEEINLKGNSKKHIVLINEAINAVAAKGYQLKQLAPAGEITTVYIFEKKN